MLDTKVSDSLSTLGTRATTLVLAFTALTSAMLDTKVSGSLRTLGTRATTLVFAFTAFASAMSYTKTGNPTTSSTISTVANPVLIFMQTTTALVSLDCNSNCGGWANITILQ
jgi:hypothetical protein